MARHRLTRPDPKGRTNRRGYIRRVQLPAGSKGKTPMAKTAHRQKPRAHLNARLAAEPDPIRRLELALDYVKSAHRKYEPRPDVLGRVERALIRFGDQMFAGRRLPANAIADNRNRR